MRTIRMLVAAVFLGVFTTSAIADLGKQMAIIGDWTIFKKQDAMTDQIYCVGVYRNRTEVQLSVSDFAVSANGRGGLSGYQYRIDDGAASAMILPNPVEKDVGFALIKGADYDSLRNAKRLRVEIFTILNTEINEDVSLTSAGKAIDYMKSIGCPQ